MSTPEIEVRAAARMVLSDQRQSWPDDSAETLIYQAWDSISITGYAVGAVALDDDGSELAAAYRILLEYLNNVWDRRRSLGDVRDATRELTDNII